MPASARLAAKPMTNPRSARSAPPARRTRRSAVGVSLLAAVALLAGCSGSAGGLGGLADGVAGLTGSPGSTTIASAIESTVLAADWRAGVYSVVDEATGDLYFTDLPEPVWRALAAGETPPTPAVGQVLRIHLFLVPRAGRTPIDFTASNVTLTHVVFAGSAVGVYGGGGFMLPSGEPGDRAIAGRLEGATVEFVGGSPTFDDRLTAGVLSGRVRAVRNEDAAAALGRIVFAALDRAEQSPATDG
jgi:hypothetical protein